MRPSPFASAWATWRGAATGLRDDLATLRRILDATNANHVAAQQAGLRAWSGQADGGGDASAPAAVVAMSAAPGPASDAPPWVRLSVAEIAAAARVTTEAQDRIAGACTRSGLETSGGVAGDDAALAAWRGRYDTLASRTWDVLGAGVAVFGGIAVGLTDTANAWVDADESAVPGGAPGERLPAPAVVPGLAAPGPAPSTGPGLVGPVPDVIAAYYPDVDATRLDPIAGAWRSIATTVATAITESDRALSAVRAANAGPVFDAMQRYWTGLHQPCGTDRLLDLASTVPGVLAANVEDLAEIVRATQQEIGAAFAHRPIGTDDDEIYYLLQGAKIGVSFLGAVGRVGTRLVDAAETGVRIHLARQRYEDTVAELVARLDQRLVGRLIDATHEPRTVQSVAPQFAPPPTALGDLPLPPLWFDQTQIQDKFTAHAAAFGVTGPRSRAALQQFQLAVEEFIGRLELLHFRGTYHGNPVVFTLDPTTRLVAMQEPDGRFLSGWRLNPTQLENVVTRQSL